MEYPKETWLQKFRGRGTGESDLLTLDICSYPHELPMHFGRSRSNRNVVVRFNSKIHNAHARCHVRRI